MKYLTQKIKALFIPAVVLAKAIVFKCFLTTLYQILFIAKIGFVLMLLNKMSLK